MAVKLTLPITRNAVTYDVDRVPLVVKDYDEQFPVQVDWADRLDTSETIATSTWETSGPTIVSSTNTTTTATVTIKDGAGELTNKVTTSASRILQERIRVETKPRTGIDDYGR